MVGGVKIAGIAVFFLIILSDFREFSTELCGSVDHFLINQLMICYLTYEMNITCLQKMC